MKNLPVRHVEPAPWLREAERLSESGLLLPDIAAGLSHLGYTEMAVAFAVSAIRSDQLRARRANLYGPAGSPF